MKVNAIEHVRYEAKFYLWSADYKNDEKKIFIHHNNGSINKTGKKVI